MTQVNSPYSSDRDGNVGTGNAFDAEPDVSDSHLDAFQAAFRPPNDPLSEQDYRGPTQGGSGFQDVEPHHVPAQDPQRFTYPLPQAGGKLAD